jgi:hypothetical protein
MTKECPSDEEIEDATDMIFKANFPALYASGEIVPYAKSRGMPKKEKVEVKS